MEDPPIKFREPLWKETEIWEFLVQWLFLGRADKMSKFSDFPIEIIFHVTGMVLV
jgi:hypothetical protein